MSFLDSLKSLFGSSDQEPQEVPTEEAAPAAETPEEADVEELAEEAETPEMPEEAAEETEEELPTE